MILDYEQTLESRVEDEVKQAIDALLDDKTEDLEALTPMIEQQIDTKTYESTTYTINLGESKTTYEGQTYYEQITAEQTANGAAVTTTYSEKEHETLKEAQKIADNAREADTTRNFYVEAVIDANVKEAKNNIKTFSPALWQAMYNGKLVFN